MSSTTDVLMSFLGDLDSEPDFFFPDIDDNDIGAIDFSAGLSPSHCGTSSPHSSSPGSQVYSLEDHHKAYQFDFPYDFQRNLEIEQSSLMKRRRDDGGISSDASSDDFDAIQSLHVEKRVAREAVPSGGKKQVGPKIKKKKDPPPPKQKKKKLTMDEKMQKLVQTLRNMRKTVEPPSPPTEDISSTSDNSDSESQLDKVYGMAEDFLSCIFGGKSQNGCTPIDLIATTENNGSLYLPALTSLFSLAHLKRRQKKLSAWAPVHESVEIFPERHSGVGQIAAASRCFARILSDLLTEQKFKGTEISVSVRRSAMSYGNQLIAPFIWKCKQSDESCKDIEFSGLIRCTVGAGKFSFVHISFDAFTIIRQSEQL